MLASLLPSMPGPRQRGCANYSSSCAVDSYDNGAHWTRVASLAATSWWLRLRGTYTHVVSGARRGRLCVSLSRLVT